MHNFASFFQNFLGGPEPPPKGGDTPPVPYPLGPSGLETPPPRLSSGSATVISSLIKFKIKENSFDILNVKNYIILQ